MDLIIPALASEGIPAIVLLIAMRATGLKGGARLTTALAGIGPKGMLGGLWTLGAIQIITFILGKAGIETIYRGVVQELFKRGETPASLEAKIDQYRISDVLKGMLKSDLARYSAENI